MKNIKLGNPSPGNDLVLYMVTDNFCRIKGFFIQLNWHFLSSKLSVELSFETRDDNRRTVGGYIEG